MVILFDEQITVNIIGERRFKIVRNNLHNITTKEEETPLQQPSSSLQASHNSKEQQHCTATCCCFTHQENASINWKKKPRFFQSSSSFNLIQVKTFCKQKPVVLTFSHQ
jgi:hypothetical protein